MFMTTALINLTESQANALHALARKTGKTEDELLREAVNSLIGHTENLPSETKSRLANLRRARGIWKERKDLPDFERLRAEWDRFDLGLD